MTVNYADLFLANGFGISLGDETSEGGVTKAGLYQVSSYKTSNDVWGSVPGVIYAAGYILNGKTYLSPTVITGGSMIENATVAQTLLQNGEYELSITLANVDGLSGELSQGIFWGTGNCSNGGEYLKVPEPASIGLLGLGVAALMFSGAVVRRRNAIRRVAGLPVTQAGSHRLDSEAAGVPTLSGGAIGNRDDAS
jgi:hypothetical protein